MPFGTITSNAVTFTPRSTGVYVDSTVTFGNPTNEYRVRPATKPNADGKLRAAVSRITEKNVTVNGISKRDALATTISFVVPANGFTAAEIDAHATDLANFLTVDTITRILQQEA